MNNKRCYFLSENSINVKVKNIFQKEHEKYLMYQSQYLNNIYNSIIFEDFPIFPVPELLIDDIMNQVKYLKRKKYFVSDIINKYKNKFDNYELFCSGLHDLFKLNKNSFIQLKYLNEDEMSINGLIHSIDDYFNCELLINKKIINNDLLLKTTIQHEIIHWLQTEINGTTLRKHGIWPSLTYLDFLKNNFFSYILSLINLNTINYLFSEREFEAYCSNACEYLTGLFYEYKKINNKLTKEQFFNNFNKCLNNLNLFQIQCEKFKTKYQHYVELFIFCKLCDLCLVENRYELYLKEVLFEHLKNN